MLFLFLLVFVESGIIADISSSPDNEVQTADETNAWKKSATAYLQHKTSIDNNGNQKSRSALNANITQKITNTDNDMLGANSTTNPYINNDSIAVHL